MDGWMVYMKTVADAMLVPRKRIFGRIYTCEENISLHVRILPGVRNRVIVH